MCAPVMFLIVFGIVEYGRMTMIQNALTNAAREGCRSAVLATTRDVNQVNATVDRNMTVAAPTTECEITCTPNDLGAIESGTPITVDVALNYSDVSWLPIGGLLGNVQLRGRAVQERE